MRIGLIVNPCAGIGGKLALKGSDQQYDHATALGALPTAGARVVQSLQHLLDCDLDLQWLVAPQQMGFDFVQRLGFTQITQLEMSIGQATSADDTLLAAEQMRNANVDLLLFAGGDGTARNICSVIKDSLPVLGIPAGVKIQSAVYAITPKAAAEVVKLIINRQQVRIALQEVRDIDEQALREGRVNSKYYGEMRVPEVGEFVQAVKVGGIEDPELVSQDIAHWLVSEMLDNVAYFVGAGRTLQALMDELGLENTLLGVDVVFNQQVICRDATEAQLLEIAQQHSCRMLVSIIGGQGHVFGRGNQQFSAQVIRQIGKQHIQIIATRNKLQTLARQALVADTSDELLDTELAGLVSILVGYNDYLLYPMN